MVKARYPVLCLGGATIALFAACDPGFQNPTEVLDLRPLAMVAEPPEQVLDIDPMRLPSPQDLLALLRPVDICGLTGDPLQREVRWSFTVCVEDVDVRCDETRPKLLLAAGTTPDPEQTVPRPSMCARLEPTLPLLLVLQSAIEADPLAGFSGIDLLVEWKLEADGEPELYAGKRIRFAARVPATRTANRNPSLTGLTARVGDGDEVPLQQGRCVDQTAPLTVRAGERVAITPVEPAGVRGTYVVPTFEGEIRQFTETIEYSWYTSSGTFSSQGSGGKRDVFGNLPGVDNTFRAPEPKRVTEPVDAAVWIVQRDERLGEAFYESCIRVTP
jgi:hypothetical protein